MKRRYVYDRENDRMVEVETVRREVVTPDVMPDIKPYKSMVTGEMITSRSRHREHLKDHGCIEVGNETKHLLNAYDKVSPNVKPHERKELIRAQVDAMSHDDFTKMVKRDLDRIRWNSR